MSGGSCALLPPLDEFDSIAEWIGHINPLANLKRCINDHWQPRIFAGHNRARQAIYQKSGMRLARGTKRFLDPQMHLKMAGFEPHPAALPERRRLLDLDQSKHGRIKRSSDNLPPARHR